MVARNGAVTAPLRPIARHGDTPSPLRETMGVRYYPVIRTGIGITCFGARERTGPAQGGYAERLGNVGVHVLSQSPVLVCSISNQGGSMKWRVLATLGVLALARFSAHAQQEGLITGKVTSDAGAPIAGAQVYVEKMNI